MAPGFYGKLPDRGDFITRRLPGEFVQPWDLWLRESLASSQAQLGADWLEIYLTSPLWRFALAPGLAGQSAWAGVLMPSVDRVGRYFPLTVACECAAATDLFAVMLASEWFEPLESLTLSALEEESSLEVFDTRLQELTPPGLACTSAPPDGDVSAVRANAWCFTAASPQVLPGACRPLLARALEQMFCAYSLWWSVGSERVTPSFLTCQGLPPADGFAALLSGDWESSHWWRLEVPADAG